MDKKDIIRKQFNIQAEKFSSWVGTTNERILQQLFDFIDISESDELLDVACGSGEFAIFCAKRIRHVCGVDLSVKMIELANKQAKSDQLNNAYFVCHDVEHLPFESDRFSVVASRSAFHHMENYDKVFGEMARCCKVNGLLCIADITAYDTPHVSNFFDELDKAIDISHNVRVSKDVFLNLFTRHGVEILKASDIEFEIGIQVYASHAFQSEEANKKVDELLEYGLKDREISKSLYMKDNKLVFKNRGFCVVGSNGCQR
jgi:ubiquinone/menaquinone biosynthesis C-methylase UbiE